MHNLTQIFQQAFSSQSQTVTVERSHMIIDAHFPSERDIFSLRKQRGVNLGSWFVLERWITDGPFRNASGAGQSDLDVARGSQAREILEHHWDTWITDEDFSWLAERGITAVRIPIGYYHISGADPSVLRGTDFADYLSVYEGAWTRIMNAIATARQHGLGVLVDLHAAPGKQNRDAHSGTSSPNVQFFTKHNMAHTTHILCVLMTQLTRFAQSHDPPLQNIIGIELLNEPQADNHNSDLERWYLDTTKALRKIDPRMPIYIGDAWWTDRYAAFMEANTSSLAPSVLDHHLYRCFTQEDVSAPVSQHIHNLRDPNAGTPQMFARAAQKLESVGCAMVVGEWSGALNPRSLHGVNNEIELRRDYIAAQLALYERHCAGYYFWTYKKEYAGDKGWSFRDAVDAGIFPSHVGIKADLLRNANNNDSNTEWIMKRHEAKDRALNEHAKYWGQYLGKYEHWRFEEGFLQGWDDAWLFATSASSIPALATVPVLGFKGMCAKGRSAEHAERKGQGNLWEFEHGYSQGINAAYDDLGAGN